MAASCVLVLWGQVLFFDMIKIKDLILLFYLRPSLILFPIGNRELL